MAHRYLRENPVTGRVGGGLASAMVAHLPVSARHSITGVAKIGYSRASVMSVPLVGGSTRTRGARPRRSLDGPDEPLTGGNTQSDIEAGHLPGVL